MNKLVLTQRISYGALALAAVVGLFLADAAVAERFVDLDGPWGHLLRRGSFLPIVSTLVFLLAAVELNHLCVLCGAQPHSGLAYTAVVAMMLSPWLSAAGLLGDGAAEVEGHYWSMVLMAAAAIGAGVASVFRKKTGGALAATCSTWFIVGYLGFLGSFGIQLSCGLDMPPRVGAWLLLYVILVTKFSDIGAFLMGSAIGKHKLIPTISPGKSVEGMIGGFLASALIAVALVVLAETQLNTYIASQTASGSLGFHETLLVLTRCDSMSPRLRAALFGFCLSLAGQMGDLVESSFKRDAMVKDSGRVIPRFGGILDLVDSLAPALPIGWFLFTLA